MPLTPEQIEAGWTPIEGMGTLVAGTPGRHEFINRHGYIDYYEKQGGLHPAPWLHLKTSAYFTSRQMLEFNYIGFRPASVGDSGFEKKTMFGEYSLYEIAGPPVGQFASWVIELARHTKRCHDEIGRQKIEIECSRIMVDTLSSAKEWIPIESVEQLEDLPAATFEMRAKCADVLRPAMKYSDGVWGLTGEAGFFGALEVYDRFDVYRLITKAEDFVLPEPPKLITLNIAGHVYDVENTSDWLKKNICEFADAIREAENNAE